MPKQTKVGDTDAQQTSQGDYTAADLATASQQAVADFAATLLPYVPVLTEEGALRDTEEHRGGVAALRAHLEGVIANNTAPEEK